MAVYYNENDKNAADWLRELIKEKVIAFGEVDDRSIEDVGHTDLRGYTQHHFFAGIGGWSYALRLAGWPDEKTVWTASCPCQPFSTAGNRKGKSDKRHLWPVLYSLIKKYKPDIVFGEQVESAIRVGWLDDLQTDLEKENYAIGHCVLGAHSVGIPHIRQRIYWVANSNNERSQGWTLSTKCTNQQIIRSSGMADWMGNHSCKRFREERSISTRPEERTTDASPINQDKCTRSGHIDGMAYAESERGCGRIEVEEWRNPEFGRSSANKWVECGDGKWRPIESSIQPLVDGVSKGVVYSSDPSETCNATQEARVMRLKGYGNAIVPQVAAEFIKAFVN